MRIFMVSDYYLMLESIKALLARHPERFSIAGETITHDGVLQSLGSTQADILLLDIDGAPAAIPMLVSSVLASYPNIRVMLFTGQNNIELQDQLVLLGARGIINRSIAPALLVTALEKVHGGEMWLDHASTSRLFMEFTRQMSGNTIVAALSRKLNLLNRREREIVAYIAKDQTAPGKVIARQLNISESTLRNNLTSIYEKLEVANRHGLIAFTTRHPLPNWLAPSA